MKIGLDFDGVIVNCGKLKSEVAKELYGADIPLKHLKKETVIGKGWLTLGQYRELQKIIYCTRETGFAMRPVRSALRYLAKLLSDGHFVKIVTSRHGDSLVVAMEWLDRRGFGEQLEFFSAGYQQSKVEGTRGLDLFIDDDLKKLKPLVGIVPNLFLFSWEYNLCDNAEGVAERVSSWKEFYKKIRSLDPSCSEKRNKLNCGV